MHKANGQPPCGALACLPWDVLQPGWLVRHIFLIEVGPVRQVNLRIQLGMPAATTAAVAAAWQVSNSVTLCYLCDQYSSATEHS
jgi:hypothetical protein